MRKLFFIIFYFSLLIGFLFGCYPTFMGYSHLLSSSVEIQDEKLCSSELNQSFHENKVLFVIDKATNNRDSDPTNLRFENIRSFINRYQHFHLSYGLIYFRDKKTQSLFSQNEIPIFTKDLSLVEEKLNQIEQIDDKGREDYDSILETIEKTITHDQEMRQKKVINYFIYYISDGSKMKSQKEEEDRFLNGISRLTEKWNQVKVYGVYFGNYQNLKKSFGKRTMNLARGATNLALSVHTGFPMGAIGNKSSEEEKGDTDDVRFIKNIAEKGKGNYIDLNIEHELKLDSEATKLWSLDRFFVYNLNSAFCFDGYMGVDSDSDGLCDLDEEKMEGFFSNKKFSFNDGYSDYFHWLAFHKETHLPFCQDRRDDDQDLLTVCEEKYLNSLFEDEEGLVPLKGNNPDSDGDTIIDGIEVFVYLSVDPRAALDSQNLYIRRVQGEESDLNKLLKHMSPFVSSQEQESFGLRMTPLSDKDESCYGIQNGSFPLYPTLSFQDSQNSFSHEEGQNVLFIYALQKKGESEDKIYQFGFKTVEQNSSHLSLPEFKTRMFRF